MQVTTRAKELLFSTVRLETDSPSGPAVGTSFIVMFEHEGKAIPVLATNKHVIRDATTCRFFFTAADRGVPRIGDRVDVTISNCGGVWVGHPDASIDVAVMPLAVVLGELEKAGRVPFFRAVPQALVADTAQLEELDAIEDVVFVGYPAGQFDPTNLVPVVRRGITATPPALDYAGTPTFLIDASVFPGSSGSPVLIYSDGAFRHEGVIKFGSRVLLLGIVAQVKCQEDTGQLVLPGAPPGAHLEVRFHQLMDLGVVYKSPTIVETCRELLRVRGLVT